MSGFIVLDGYRRSATGEIAVNVNAISFVLPSGHDIETDEPLTEVLLREGPHSVHGVRTTTPYDEVMRRINAAESRHARAIAKRLDAIADRLGAGTDR